VGRIALYVKKTAAKLKLLLTYGLLQRKVLKHGYSGLMHLAISSGFLILLAGSVLVGLLHPAGDVNRILHAVLDCFGLVLFIGLILSLQKHLRIKPAYITTNKQILSILFVLTYIVVTGFVLEGLRMSSGPKADAEWAFVGRTVAAMLGNTDLSDENKLLFYKPLWWSHALAAFAFIALLPYTRLVHVFTAPVNILFSSSQLKGRLGTPFLLTQLIESGSFDVKVGADTISDFDWQQRLGICSCTYCGRCEEVCPAYITGTSLSPSKVIQNLRDEINKIGDRNEKREKQNLIQNVITEDEIWACTQCGACIQACPVLINPPAYLIQLRRALVSRNMLDKKKTGMLTNLNYRFNPYGLPHSQREDLAMDLGVQSLSENPDVDYLYWIGCSATYDARSREIVKAVFKILKKAGVSFGILGAEEKCTGDPARRLGEEGKFQELVFLNLETLNRYRIKKIITHCAHCFNTLKNEYPEFGGKFEVIHHSTFIYELIRQGKIELTREFPNKVTFHDSCYIGRFNQIFDPARNILRSVPGLDLVEMKRNKEQSFCCGAGGANYWYDVSRSEKTNIVRHKEAMTIEAGVIVTECPYCLRMCEEASTIAGPQENIKIRDVAEIVAASID
jgi:Fe-S oxidoreductase/nitrate reductase gamma subunit